MNEGSFGCESNEFTRPSWFKRKNILATGGEPLGGFTLDMQYFDGFRCENCRILVLRY